MHRNFRPTCAATWRPHKHSQNNTRYPWLFMPRLARLMPSEFCFVFKFAYGLLVYSRKCFSRRLWLLGDWCEQPSDLHLHFSRRMYNQSTLWRKKVLNIFSNVRRLVKVEVRSTERLLISLFGCPLMVCSYGSCCYSCRLIHANFIDAFLCLRVVITISNLEITIQKQSDIVRSTFNKGQSFPLLAISCPWYHGILILWIERQIQEVEE